VCFAAPFLVFRRGIDCDGGLRVGRGSMDGWVEGLLLDGWRDGWVEGWMGGDIDGWRDGWVEAWMGGGMDRGRDG